MKAPKTIYLRNLQGAQPRVTTLVYTLGTSPDGRDYAHVGYAICNVLCDSFSRKIGRKIAMGRLTNVRTLIFMDYPAEVNTWKGRLACLLTRLSISPSMEGALVNVPNRLHRAIYDYLVEEPVQVAGLLTQFVTELNPGIRKVVALLNAAGYKTCDSGDGKTHDFSCDRNEPYVVVVSRPDSLAEDAQAIKVLLEAAGVKIATIGNIDENSVQIQATYDPAMGIDHASALIDIRGIHDDMLIRS